MYRAIDDHARVTDPSAPRDRLAWQHCFALGQRLLDRWFDYNREYAGLRLRAPVLRVLPLGQTLGSWHRDTRELRISYEHILRDTWTAVLATLRHEMAHQYADEVLQAHDEVAHGQAFRRACQILRADPAARVAYNAAGTGAAADGAAAPPDDPTERLMRRVAKLLALGGSPNEHEAASAVQKARALMLEHNLEVLAAKRERGFEVRMLGGVRRRRHSWERALFGLLPEFFFVEVINVQSYDAVADVEGSTYEVFGTKANLAMAEYVHAYVLSVLPGLWEDHRTTTGVRGDRDRLQFFEGVVAGFRKRLAAEESARLSGENALVWRGDPALTAFYRDHYPRIRSLTRSGRERGAAYGAGREAGLKLTLRKPLSSESGGFGGLLGG